MPGGLNAERLSVAVQAVQEGMLPAAAGLCQLVLRTEPESRPAWELLAEIAEELGARSLARQYYARAGAGFRAAAVAPGPDADENADPHRRHLLVKAWGHGFWSEVSHVLGGLLLADITRRTPVVHWGRNSLFGDGTGADAFAKFFEPVSRATLADVAASRSFYPPKWNASNLAVEELQKWDGAGSRLAALHFLNRAEASAVADFHLSVAALAPFVPPWHPLHGQPAEALYRTLLPRLAPSAPMRALCDEFHARHLAGGPYAAIHLRGSDKQNEGPDLHRLNERLFDLAAGLPGELRLFVLTDDLGYAARMRERFGQRVVLADCERTGGATGVHFLQGGDGARRGAEVLRDALLAARADWFLGNGYSNLSGMVALMKAWPTSRCQLVAPPYVLQSQPVLYLPLPLARRLAVAQPGELVTLAQ
jgi:hypothetical protein